MAGCCMPVPSFHPPPLDFVFLHPAGVYRYSSSVLMYSSSGDVSAVVDQNRPVQDSSTIK